MNIVASRSYSGLMMTLAPTRFVSLSDKPFIVKDEQADFRFPEDRRLIFLIFIKMERIVGRDSGE